MPGVTLRLILALYSMGSLRSSHAQLWEAMTTSLQAWRLANILLKSAGYYSSRNHAELEWNYF